MDRTAYVQKLKSKLGQLPYGEAENAVQYYEEYFDEAGAENEQKVIEELGPPEKLAQVIRADSAVREMEQSGGSARKGLRTVFLVILAIFASPIAIPIALAVVIVAVAVLISLLAVLLSLFASGIGAAAGGIAMVICAFMVILQSPATFLFFCGMGLSAAAVGVGIFALMLLLSKKCFMGLAGWLNRFLQRRTGK